LVPTLPQIPDLRGLQVFLENVEQLREALNPGLENLGILITFFDRRVNHHKQSIEVLKQSGLPVLDVMIGRSVRVSEAADNKKSIVRYRRTHKAALAYARVGEIVVERLDLNERDGVEPTAQSKVPSAIKSLLKRGLRGRITKP
jgi:chromosome partitioning protein